MADKRSGIKGCLCAAVVRRVCAMAVYVRVWPWCARACVSTYTFSPAQTGECVSEHPLYQATVILGSRLTSGARVK
jgi:hypothetical protein